MTSYRATVQKLSVCVCARMHGVSVYGLNQAVHNAILATVTLTALQKYNN